MPEANPLERSRLFSEQTMLTLRRRHEKAIRRRSGSAQLRVSLAILLFALLAAATILLVTVALTRSF